MNKNIPMIRLEHISKQYRLGEIGGTTLRFELQRLHAKMRRQEDPNSLIGTNYNLSNEIFYALNDISFDVQKGERLGIIGRNGAGKSTLLKLISRVTAPTDGEIGLNGRVASMLEIGTGFHSELTGRENIYMNGAILGMSRREIDSKIEDIIDFSECRQFIDTPVKRYSSGMYVKLAFAVAAHLDSEILIMDEVLAVGDMPFQKKCLDKMNDVARSQDRTILYVSHNMNTIRQLCSSCIVLDHGQMIYNGNVEQAIALYLKTGDFSYSQEVDLTNEARLRDSTGKAHFIRAVFMKADNTYSAGDEMNVNFEIEANDYYDDIRFMAILFSFDGTRVAKTESENFTVQKGLNMIRASFPLDGIANGQYYFEINILRRYLVGSWERFDGIPNVLPITIYNPEVYGVSGEEWSTNFFGHMMLKQIRIN